MLPIRDELVHRGRFHPEKGREVAQLLGAVWRARSASGFHPEKGREVAQLLGAVWRARSASGFHPEKGREVAQLFCLLTVACGLLFGVCGVRDWESLSSWSSH
jgi:hypothetical protein